MIALIPKFTPNPRDPGDVWSSYEGATPTQESPRNKLERMRMQTQTTAQKTGSVYTPVEPTHKEARRRFNRRAGPAAEKKQASVKLVRAKKRPSVQRPTTAKNL